MAYSRDNKIGGNSVARIVVIGIPAGYRDRLHIDIWRLSLLFAYPILGSMGRLYRPLSKHSGWKISGTLGAAHGAPDCAGEDNFFT